MKQRLFEVERKFRDLAVKQLTVNGGSPPFRSLAFHGRKSYSDVYYDRSSLLLSAGVWVRQRNGQWQAKIKKGGDYNNSIFEELSGLTDVSAYVQSLTKMDQADCYNFGLQPVASFTTLRKSWVVDGEFKVVLDEMDFGHTVGEVELTQRELLPADTEMTQAVTEAMNQRIKEFMHRYSWAFVPGTPKGKLTAYFERNPIA